MNPKMEKMVEASYAELQEFFNSLNQKIFELHDESVGQFSIVMGLLQMIQAEYIVNAAKDKNDALAMVSFADTMLWEVVVKEIDAREERKDQ